MSAVGQGFVSSENVDSEREAAKKLFEEAKEDLGKDEADLGLIFMSSEFVAEDLTSHLGEEMYGFADDWIGCTTAGEISNEGSTVKGAVLTLLKLDNTDIQVGISRNVYDEPIKSGEEALNNVSNGEFMSSDRNKAIFTLMPGMTQDQPGVEFDVLKGISNEMSTRIPVIGGSAADDVKLERNYQIFNGGVYEDAVIAVSFLTDLEIAVGKEHGFHNKVESGVANSTDGRVIEEISGKPAAEFYADVIGKDIEEVSDTFEAPTGVEFCNVFKYALEDGIAEELSNGDLRLITPLDVTEENGLIMTTEVDENSLLHIVEGDEEDLISAGKNAFDHVEGDIKGLVALISDCTCRNQSLDQESLDEEVRQMREFLGCPVTGFYGYGEIGGKEETFCTFQNQTVSGLLFYE